MTEPLLSPRLQSLLARSRLRPLTALPSGGLGDRSSKAKGSGLEFAEHRPYQPGDDLRHVDPHLEARLGETFIRQYSVDQQLPVTVLIDASGSMEVGEPTKLAYAARLAAALGYLALSGNDRLKVGTYAGGRVRWTDWFSGVRQSERLFGWLQDISGDGAADLGEVLSLVVPTLPPTGLLVVISDWLSQDVGKIPTMLGAEGRDVLALHVFTPEEADPALLEAAGGLRIVDSETGEELDVALGEQALAEYRQAWSSFSQHLRDGLQSQRALYLPVDTSADLESLLLRDWTRLGLILR